MNVYHDKYNKKRPVIHFRVTPEVKKRLMKLAKLRKTKVANMIEVMVSNWVGIYED